jgi:hypothetical protein
VIVGFLLVLRFPPPIHLTAPIIKILLKVALNTIKWSSAGPGILVIHVFCLFQVMYTMFIFELNIY